MPLRASLDDREYRGGELLEKLDSSAEMLNSGRLVLMGPPLIPPENMIANDCCRQYAIVYSLFRHMLL